MRLIIISILFALLSSLSVGKLACQTQIDTINLSETSLEERHLRYMYNFALNTVLFQTEGELSHIEDPKNRESMDYNNYSLLLITNEFRLGLNQIESFVYPCAICNLSYIYDSHNIALMQPLRTQYEMILHPIAEEKKNESTRNRMARYLRANKNSKYSIAFTGLYQDRYYYYLKTTIGFYIVYPDLVYTIDSIIEFRWCEAKKQILPNRVSSTLFDLSINPIQVKSLWCPN